jgi:hypothetical protein
VAILSDHDVSGWRLAMLAKLKLALVAAVLGGLVVVSAQTGSRAAVPVDPLGITPQETQQFKDLIDPATWNMDALVAWLEKLRETRPDPGVIGENSLDLALLVDDDNPNQDIIFALLQDMLATAVGPPAFVDVGIPFFGVPPGFVPPGLSEIPCTVTPSPICGN